MPSNMEAGGVLELELPKPPTPLLAVSAIPPQQRFPITPWRMRDGRNADFVAWLRWIKRLLSAFGVSWEQLHELQPPSSANKPIVIRADRNGAKQSVLLAEMKTDQKGSVRGSRNVTEG